MVTTYALLSVTECIDEWWPRCAAQLIVILPLFPKTAWYTYVKFRLSVLIYIHREFIYFKEIIVSFIDLYLELQFIFSRQYYIRLPSVAI